ncbi:MAG TPA: hypothetical protein VGN42_05655 [Pirellulales bacterium]|nr:hypothetical protein [Pirellulales bacterium]
MRGVLVVAAGAAAIFLAMHYALGFAFGKDAAALYPRQRPLGWLMYERIWGRVSAIDRLYRSGQLPADTRLGVFLGVSTAATGIERQFLDARATTADRWIVLSGAGLSFENIENVMCPVFFCSLKPSTVVFGVHPQMLVGERYIGDEPTLAPQRVVGRRRRALESGFAGFRALIWLRKHWAIQNRAIAADFLRSQIYGLRLFFFYHAGVTAESLSRPYAEPWDENPLWLWNMDDAQNEIAHDQVEFWTLRGHFKAENYDPDGNQARSLVRMIRAYRKLGAKVYVVVMPLRSTLRSIVPPNAKPCLLDALHQAFPEAPPTVIDMQEAIPDRLFTDEAHLSRSGAERLSKQVAERLRAPDASPPTPDVR